MVKNKIVSSLSLLGMMIFLCSCTSQTDIVFHKVTTVAVDEIINTCTFVKTVDGKEVTEFHYDGNQIVMDNEVIKCPSLDTSKIGKQELVYYYKQKKYMLSIEVVDNQPPVFTKAVEQIEIETNSSSDVILKHFEIKDHDQEAEMKLKGDIDYRKAGIYHLIVEAKDNYGNVSKREIVVTIKEQEKKELPKVDAPSFPPSLPTIESKPQTGGESTNGNTRVQVSAEEKTFLFSDGYDYNSSYEASISYAKSMIAQKKANGYDCFPIRDEKKEYIGYRVTFK